MDKKALVRLLRPVFQSLQQTGLVITDVELLPISLKGYYTLAVSADWPVSMSTMDKIKAVTRFVVVARRMLQYKKATGRNQIF